MERSFTQPRPTMSRAELPPAMTWIPLGLRSQLGAWIADRSDSGSARCPHASGTRESPVAWERTKRRGSETAGLGSHVVGGFPGPQEEPQTNSEGALEGERDEVS